MKRTVHTLLQGSPEWHAYRAKHFNASDCPAMLGISSYKSRDALLKEKATGITPEIDANTQRIFDQGHQFEAMARPLAEAYFDDELYPITMSLELDGLSLSASLDGLTMLGDRAWEHKTINANLDTALRSGSIPEQYRAQMEMQLLVSGAEYCLFMASRGTQETMLQQPYESDSAMRERIIQGWKQFAIDLANYVMPEAEAAKAIAEPVETLPAITYSTDFKSTGLELRSNIEAFKAAAQRLAEQSKKQLESDQDFANAEARIKSCKAAEEKIAVIQSNVVGEVADIDKFVKDLGAISEMLRQCRLNEDKQVKARKEAIKHEEVTRAHNEFNAHTVGMNERLYKMAKVQMPLIASFDPLGTIKGLKTVASLRSKLNDEIARAKIQADAIYEKIVFNIDTIKMHAGDYGFLFSDMQNLVLKDSEYVTAIAQQRVSEHKAAEQARIQAEAQRLANEQLERDRFNKEQMEKREQAEAQAAERAKTQDALNSSAATILHTIPVHVGDEVVQVVTHAHEDIPADYEQYAAQAPAFEESFNQVFAAEIKPAAETKNDFQKGVISGLELALKIFAKHGANGFTKAVQDFIEVGVPAETNKAA